MTDRVPFIAPPKQPPARASFESVATPLCLLAAFVAGMATEARAPYLTPPAKPRINMIDATQQAVNLPLLTFVPPPPFAKLDWSKPFFPVFLSDNHRATNINLLTNPIPAFTPDYSDGPWSVRRFAPDQTYPNLPLTAPPPPFTPDTSDGPWPVRRYAPDQIYPNITLALTLPPPPLITPDYSDGPWSVRRYAPDQTYPNLVLLAAYVAGQQFEPRTAYLTPPFDIRGAPVDASLPLNLPLTTTVTVTMPFGPFDWSKPTGIRALPVIPAPPYNPNLYQNPIPFGPYDYSVGPVQFRLRVPDPIERNPLIYSEVPVVPVDYNIVHALVRSPPQPQPYNINVYTNPLPFGPFDYNIAHTVISSPPQAIPYNPNLFTNPIPFGPYDWSYRPSQYPPRAPDQIYYDIALNVTPPPPAPFAQYDWSKPFYPRVLKENASQTNINLMPNPIPFGPYDWSYRSFQYPPRAPDVFHRNPLIFSEVPLIPVDLSRPVRFQAPPLVAQPYSIALTAPTAAPFQAIDFTRSVRAPALPPVAPPYNVALYQPPIIPVDLSTSQRLPALPPAPLLYNVTLLQAPFPLQPIDWSKPFAIRPVPPQDARNLTITLPPPPPPPIVPFDWSKPWQIRPVPPQPQPNLTLYLPPPRIIGVPSLCFSKDVPVNVSRAYDTATQQAKAVDFRLYKASAVDLGTAKAQSKDILLFTAKANTTPAGQDWSGAGYMAQYEIDTAIELQGVFINALTGVYIDPTSINLLVLDPSGAQTTYTWPSSTIVRDSVGHFHQVITPAKSGLWTYKWQGTGAAVATSPDTTFTINASALIPG